MIDAKGNMRKRKMIRSVDRKLYYNRGLLRIMKCVPL